MSHILSNKILCTFSKYFLSVSLFINLMMLHQFNSPNIFDLVQCCGIWYLGCLSSHNVVFCEKSNWTVNVLHKLHTFPVLVLVHNVSDNAKSSHLHHGDLCIVGDYLEAYEIYLQKSSWTHSEVQNIPIYDKLCWSILWINVWFVLWCISWDQVCLWVR